MIELPLVSDPYYKFSITLDGTTYIINVKWNDVHEFYVIDILDSAEAPIIYGIKLTLNAELIRRYNGKGVPPGAMMVIDSSGRLKRIAFDSFDTTAKLVYIPANEVEEILAAV